MYRQAEPKTTVSISFGSRPVCLAGKDAESSLGYTLQIQGSKEVLLAASIGALKNPSIPCGGLGSLGDVPRPGSELVGFRQGLSPQKHKLTNPLALRIHLTRGEGIKPGTTEARVRSRQ